MYIIPSHFIYSVIFIVMPFLISCQQSTHPYQQVVLGKSISSADMEAVIDQPGPIELNSFASANWAVDLSGLVNLNHEKAKAAKLADRPEAIQNFS